MYVMYLLRQLANAETCFVHGHVHDPEEVIATGAPYLRSRNGNGLEYRLYGLGGKCPHPATTASRRRTVRTFCVPAHRAAVLTFLDDGFQFETF
jgi:hypothetical protein